VRLIPPPHYSIDEIIRFEVGMIALGIYRKRNLSFVKYLKIFALKTARGKCSYCRCHLRKKTKKKHIPYPDEMVLDHVTPWSRGGGNNAGNILASCWKCNSLKADRDLVEFAEIAPSEQRSRLLKLAAGVAENMKRRDRQFDSFIDRYYANPLY